MEVQIYYQKKPNWDLSQGDASNLTLVNLMENYEHIITFNMPEGTKPDDIYLMYQDREIRLPEGIHHSSMFVGDIVLLDRKVCVCCTCGWYEVELSNITSGNIMAS